MAGRPKLAALEEKIAKLEDGEDTVFEWLADGMTTGAVADKLGTTRPLLYVWRNHAQHKERRLQKWDEARKLSAEAHVDRANDTLDNLENMDGGLLSPARVAVGRERIGFEMWRAKIADPEKYAEKGAAPITVNIGTLHLDALRQANRPVLPFPTSKLLEAEVVSDEPEAA